MTTGAATDAEDDQVVGVDHTGAEDRGLLDTFELVGTLDAERLLVGADREDEVRACDE